MLIHIYIIVVVEIGEGYMKTDKISFGTRPTIGKQLAKQGISKYGENLAEGITKTFTKLLENGTDDFVDIKLGKRIGIKNKGKDSLVLCYYSEDTYIPQSSKAFNPEALAKQTPEKISTIFFKTYEKLKKSTKIASTTPLSYHSQNEQKVTKPLSTKIEQLIDSFGEDDPHWLIN